MVFEGIPLVYFDKCYEGGSTVGVSPFKAVVCLGQCDRLIGGCRGI